MTKLLLIGSGGFFGSIMRYLVSGWIYRLAGSSDFPFGTLAVNIVGCFIIGFLNGMSENYHLFTPETRLFVFIGFLGGFTTFSTFGFEAFSFAHDGQFMNSFFNIFFHLLLGLTAVWLGYKISYLI